MLATVDYLVIVVYLSFVLFIGWKSSKGNNTSEDYFMAGRSLAWFPIAMSVAATTISANGFLGGPGWAYTDGLSPYMIQAAIPLAIFFVVYTTLPVCYSLKLTSIYEYIELRLGPRTRLLTVLGFFANAIIQIGSMVFIPSLVISFFTIVNVVLHPILIALEQDKYIANIYIVANLVFLTMSILLTLFFEYKGMLWSVFVLEISLGLLYTYGIFREHRRCINEI